MRVLHIINSLGTGGSETILYSLIKNDIKNFHIIILISEKGTIFKNFKQLRNCKVLDFSNLIFFKKIIRIYEFIKHAKELNKQIALNSWMYKSHIYSFIVKFFINYQILIHIRHCGITQEHLLINKIPIYITLYLSKLFANKIIYNSYFSKFNHERIGYPKKMGIVIQNGYNKIKKIDKQKSSRFKNKIVIGMLARKNFIKDHFTLIRAFKKISKINRNLVLFLQGSGLEKDRKIKDYIDKNKISNIFFSKSLDKEYFFNQTDIHVLSSYGESFPNVVVEAIQRKILSLSSDVGDVKYILPKELIFKTSNDKDLFNKLLILINLIKKKSKKIQLFKENLKKEIDKKFQFSKQKEKFNIIWNSHSKKKNALLIVPTLEGGGAERVMTFLSQDLNEIGYKTTLLVLGNSSQSQYKLNKKINLVFLNRSRSIFATFDIIKYFYRNYDVVISTIIQCNIICIFAKLITFSRIKLFVRETNTPSEILKYDWNIKNYLTFIIRKFYNLSDFILCNSVGVKTDLIKKLNIKKKKIFILPNSIDRYQILKDSKEKIKKNYSPYYLFAGRLSKQKNVQQIIQSFEIFCKENHNFKLMIFGQGSDKKNLIKLINDFKLQKKILIKPFEKNIFKYIKNSNGVLLSSKWEGMPNILLQSLYLSKPVLSTNCKSGPMELKKFGFNIRLVPVNDIKNYAKELKTLSKEKIDLKKNKILIEKYSDIYWKIINKLF